jgi:DNA-binding response OmpR family regulator
MNIGLLEDNPAIADYLSIALEMAGHNVDTYTYGSSLLEKLNSSMVGGSYASLPYNLVIVDLLLPGDISGLEAIQQIQRAIPHERLPIIIISAGSQGELKQVQGILPSIPLLRKPFRTQALLQLISDLEPR